MRNLTAVVLTVVSAQSAASGGDCGVAATAVYGAVAVVLALMAPSGMRKSARKEQKGAPSVVEIEGTREVRKHQAGNVGSRRAGMPPATVEVPHGSPTGI